MNYKFNVGDKVRIVNFIIPQQKEYVGRIATIVKQEHRQWTDNTYECYLIDIDDQFYCWKESLLELAEPEIAFDIDVSDISELLNEQV